MRLTPKSSYNRCDATLRVALLDGTATGHTGASYNHPHRRHRPLLRYAGLVSFGKALPTTAIKQRVPPAIQSRLLGAIDRIQIGKTECTH